MAGSVLETFFLLFESDASSAKKDVDELDSSLDKTAKTSKKAIDESGKVSKSFVEMGKSAIGAAAGVFALSKIISSTISMASNIDSLGKFSASIGENIENVNAWEQAVIRSGGTAESLRGSLSNLNRSLIEVSVTGTSRMLPFFNQLGVAMTDSSGNIRDTLELLPDLADAFSSLSAQESASLGQRIGLDSGTITLLQSGRREVEAIIKKQKELGVVSQRAADVSADFNDSMADLNQSLRFGSQSILVSVLPAVTKMVEALTSVSVWINKNQDLVNGFFIGLGLVVLKFAIPPILALASAVAVAVAPFLAIGVAISGLSVAFALLFEDVRAFINGQDSLLGKVLETWPVIGSTVDTVIDTVKSFFGTMKEMASLLSGVFNAPLDGLKKISGIGGSIKGFLGFGGSDDDISLAQKNLVLASSSGLSSQSSSSIINGARDSSKSTSVNTGDIIINTQATDVSSISSDISGTLSEQLKTTVDNFDDGIAI